MRNPKIGILFDKEPFHAKDFLIAAGCDVIQSLDPAALLNPNQRKSIDLLVVGSSPSTFELAKKIRKQDVSLPIIMVASQSSEEQVIAALRLGINDYFRIPVSPDELLAGIKRCLHRRTGDSSVDSLPCAQVNMNKMIGQSVPIMELKAYLKRIALTDSNVLITGETGTGKELVAQLIYESSLRYGKPFVCVNCAAIPDTLLESELFGYERGAFTGANGVKEGKLNIADEGTLFFDEIGDMTPYAQAKILRAVESKEVQRLGGKKNISVNVRFIAATNQDLERLVADKTYRSDLYFRLNVARIHLPPLRDRREDILLLLDHYIREFNRQLDRCVEGFTDEVLELLLLYPWPGNIRELKNLLEATFITVTASRITFLDLPEQFRRRLPPQREPVRNERDRLLSALFSVNWNKSRAAEKLNWSRMTLYRKMEKYGVSLEGTGPKTLESERL